MSIKYKMAQMNENLMVMNVSLEQLNVLLTDKENEHLELKEAKQNFHFEKLVKYCAALANEGGGSIVLGVTDKHPRQVVGTAAFKDLERTKAGLIERLRLRIVALKGLDRATNKVLLLEHIKNIYPEGCALEELKQVLPGVSSSFIQKLLRELRDERLISSSGQRRWTKWRLNSCDNKKA